MLKAPGKALLGHCGGGSQNSSSSSLLDRGPGKPERSSVGVVNEVILGNYANAFSSLVLGLDLEKKVSFLRLAIVVTGNCNRAPDLRFDVLSYQLVPNE